MKNLRIKEKPTVEGVVQQDWSVVSPDNADFAFRCWGGNKEIPHLTVTDDLEFAKGKSASSFVFVKAHQPHVREVFENFDEPRMRSERVGGDQNPGGQIFSVAQIEKEYRLRCEELGFEMKTASLEV